MACLSEPKPHLLLGGRRACADRGCETRVGVRAAGERADDRQINARLPVCLDPGAALVRGA